MKKFISEYKALRSKSETETSTKNLRERVTVTTHHVTPEAVEDHQTHSETHVGTIRTEEYKRDLAEFQARRSLGNRELIETPVNKKCGRHSLPKSCTECAADHDNTFNYEKKSAVKYKKKKKHVHNRSDIEPTRNIQFLFHNQVFMPGNVFATSSYSEPQKYKRRQRLNRSPNMEYVLQKHIDFKDDDQPDSPPIFFKNNSLPFDVSNFLNGSKEEVDGILADEVNLSSRSHSSAEVQNKEDSCEDKMWEVMSELKNLNQWADEQLKAPSNGGSICEDNYSDASAYGLPIASASNLDVDIDRGRVWNHGSWGLVPIQVKKLAGVSVADVTQKQNTEINILRKYRHPNIILLMGIYPDIHNNIHIICERCVDTLYGLLHVQGRKLNHETAVKYVLDVANALVFLRMQGYIHTELSSASISVTSHDVAKLADLGPCMRLEKPKKVLPKDYEVYSPEPQYVNIEDIRQQSPDFQPLLSANPSDVYLASNSVAKPASCYTAAPQFRWQPPEVYDADAAALVRVCAKGTAYSLCVILWECCVGKIPWEDLSYEKLKELYTIWRTGFILPRDGKLPAAILDVLEAGLKMQRCERIDLTQLQQNLQEIKLPENNDVTFRKEKHNFEATSGSLLSDEENPDPDRRPILKYDHLIDKDFSSACSTPISKIRARIKDIGTPGALQRSDSTEYCSILSPAACNNSIERPTAKLSRSFTPKSYKPLHIKVPEFNLDSIKNLVKDRNGSEKSSYNFDIDNYSLPSTPIARSNKLRKNAWLSGDINTSDRSSASLKKDRTPERDDGPEPKSTSASPEAAAESIDTTFENKEQSEYNLTKNEGADSAVIEADQSLESNDTGRDSFTGLRRTSQPEDQSPEAEIRERTNSWSYKSSNRAKYKVEDDVLANVNVKPLVAIHERWIYEANRKTGRSMSLPEDRSAVQGLKPASHCVDTLQKSLPQLNVKRNSANKLFRGCPASPVSIGKNGNNWEQFNQVRETIARSMNFAARDPERFHTYTLRRDSDRGSVTSGVNTIKSESKVDQATDTTSIEEFIRDLIRKEFQHLIHEMVDDNASTSTFQSQEMVNKGVANILETLNSGEESDHTLKKEPVKSFSRVKINGNNKPLLQITFSRSGDNSLQVLDNCVNVTICDSNREKNQSLEETLIDDVQVNSLKRCQAFNAIQEARSTEDLYIDDDLSTQMQENFGGRVKLIPLHGSLHEILCEKEDDCCLIKVKQENGCDTIYFRCDNSDTESRDALDGQNGPQDTVVFKRSISLVEERIQRVFPKDKHPNVKKIKVRPKSEIFIQKLTKDSRVLSNSSPSLIMKDDKSDEVEVNIEHVMSYQDSSSEECVKCLAENDDFELLEKKIEDDLANSSNLSSMTCGCLEKISEENLSVLNEEALDH